MSATPCECFADSAELQYEAENDCSPSPRRSFDQAAAALLLLTEFPYQDLILSVDLCNAHRSP